jgi:hypothetical protein
MATAEPTSVQTVSTVSSKLMWLLSGSFFSYEWLRLPNQPPASSVFERRAPIRKPAAAKAMTPNCGQWTTHVVGLRHWRGVCAAAAAIGSQELAALRVSAHERPPLPLGTG